MPNISERCLLVSLNIGRWSAKKQDKEVTRFVEEQHDAHDAGRFNKNLLPADVLKKIVEVSGKARTFFYKHTLPWGKQGEYILPSELYEEFANEIRQIKGEYAEQVKAFLQLYEDYKDNAKTTLGRLYKETDYPSVTQLTRKFYLDIKYGLVSSKDDFRVNLAQEYIDELKEAIEEQKMHSIAIATQEIWDRISEKLRNVVEKLGDEDANFKDSLVGNVRELIDLLPALNITDDPVIHEAISDMKSLFAEPGITPEELRLDSLLRSDKAREAQGILDKFGDYMQEPLAMIT